MYWHVLEFYLGIINTIFLDYFYKQALEPFFELILDKDPDNMTNLDKLTFTERKILELIAQQKSYFFFIKNL